MIQEGTAERSCPFSVLEGEGLRQTPGESIPASCTASAVYGILKKLYTWDWVPALATTQATQGTTQVTQATTQDVT